MPLLVYISWVVVRFRSWVVVRFISHIPNFMPLMPFLLLLSCFLFLPPLILSRVHFLPARVGSSRFFSHLAQILPSRMYTFSPIKPNISCTPSASSLFHVSKTYLFHPSTSPNSFRSLNSSISKPLSPHLHHPHTLTHARTHTSQTHLFQTSS